MTAMSCECEPHRGHHDAGMLKLVYNARLERVVCGFESLFRYHILPSSKGQDSPLIREKSWFKSMQEDQIGNDILS